MNMQALHSKLNEQNQNKLPLNEKCLSVLYDVRPAHSTQLEGFYKD